MSDKKRLEFELRIRESGLKVLEQMEKSLQRLGKASEDLDRKGGAVGGSGAGGTLSNFLAGGGVAGAVVAGANLITEAIGKVTASIQGLVSAGVEATKFGMEFEKTMGLVGGLTRESFAMLPELSDQVKRLSVESGLGLQDIATGMFNVISATGDAKGAFEVLTAASKLAVGGGAQLAESTDAISRTLNAYNLQADQAIRVSDALFAAQQAGITTISELSQFLGQVVPSASAANVSIEELAAAIGTTTRVIRADVALTGLRNLFIAVDSAAEDVAASSRAMAAEVGNTTFEFSRSGLQALGLQEFLKQLVQVTGGSTEKLRDFGIEARTLGVVLQLISNEGKNFADQLDNVSHSAGVTERVAGQMADTTQQKMKRLNASIETFKVLFYEEIAPKLGAVLDSIIVNFDVLKAGAELAFDVIALVFWNVLDIGARVAKSMLATFTVVIAQIKTISDGLVNIGAIPASWSKNANDVLMDSLKATKEFADVSAYAQKMSNKNSKEIVEDTRDLAAALSKQASASEKAAAMAAAQAKVEKQRAREGDERAKKAEDAAKAIQERFEKDNTITLDPERAKQMIAALRNEMVSANAEMATLTFNAQQREIAMVMVKYDQMRMLALGHAEVMASIDEAEQQDVARINAKYQQQEVDDYKKFHEELVKGAIEADYIMAEVNSSSLEREMQELETEYAEKLEKAKGHAEDIKLITKKMNADVAALQKKAREEEMRRQKEDFEKMKDEDFVTGFTAQLEEMNNEALSAGKIGQTVGRSIHDGLSTAFQEIIMGSKSAGEAFKAFGKQILATLAEVAAKAAASFLIQQLFGSTFGAAGAGAGAGAGVGGIFGGAGGAAAPTTAPTLATGGIVRTPTVAMLGERGDEAVIPLRRGRVPVDLGGSDSSGGSTQVVFNINAVDSKSFQAMASEHKDFFSDVIADAMARRANLRNSVKAAMR